MFSLPSSEMEANGGAVVDVPSSVDYRPIERQVRRICFRWGDDRGKGRAAERINEGPFGAGLQDLKYDTPFEIELISAKRSVEAIVHIITDVLFPPPAYMLALLDC